MQARFAKKRQQKQDALELSFQLSSRILQETNFPICHETASVIDWAELPDMLNPMAEVCELKKKGRAARKQQQLESLHRYILPNLKDGDVVVDFGAGSGHIGLTVAFLKPKCEVICVERCEGKCEMGTRRIEGMGLKNARFFAGGIDEFTEKFDFGVSLHSCGLLTDKAIQQCCDNNASFVLCPCCYGQLAGKETDGRRLPQSNRVREIHDNHEDFCKVVVASDYDVVGLGNGTNWDFGSNEKFLKAKRSMQGVDVDRLCRVMEQYPGYRCKLGGLEPVNCSPKNNLIIGIYDEKHKQEENAILLNKTVTEKDHALEEEKPLNNAKTILDTDTSSSEDVNLVQQLGLLSMECLEISKSNEP